MKVEHIFSFILTFYFAIFVKIKITYSGKFKTEYFKTYYVFLTLARNAPNKTLLVKFDESLFKYKIFYIFK